MNTITNGVYTEKNTTWLNKSGFQLSEVKSKVITPANHKGGNQNSKQIHVADANRGKTSTNESRSWFSFTSDLIKKQHVFF